MRLFWLRSRLATPHAQGLRSNSISKIFSAISPLRQPSIRSFSTRNADSLQNYRCGRKNAAQIGRILMRRRDFITLSAGFAAGGLTTSLLPITSVRAQTKSVFKDSDLQPPGYPTVAATENLGKKLEAATNGRLSVQMFPSMQLGGEKETIEQTQIGAIQMLRVSVGTMGPIVDDINVVNMPFLFKNTAHAQRM